MRHRGYEVDPTVGNVYDLGTIYGISQEKKRELVFQFNTSNTCAFLDDRRGAVEVVSHWKDVGYDIRVITSFCQEPEAVAHRTMVLQARFGNAFSEIQCLPLGADKDEALAAYRDFDRVVWVEDKPENAVVGAEMGYETYLMTHLYNRDFQHPNITHVDSWSLLQHYVARKDTKGRYD
jgi:hypothetical protein